MKTVIQTIPAIFQQSAHSSQMKQLIPQKELKPARELLYWFEFYAADVMQ